jgi:hypothetical protein
MGKVDALSLSNVGDNPEMGAHFRAIHSGKLIPELKAPA